MRALFTIICATLFLTLSATSIAQTPAPTVPAAKAVGNGPWADGFKHAVQGTDIGRGCLDITNFQLTKGKALYTCLTLEDQRYHVIHDVKMDERGYSRINDLEITEDNKISYVGYEGRKRCRVIDEKTSCSEGPTSGGPPDAYGGSIILGGSRYERYNTSPPALPESLTGGKVITEYWTLNNQPLWIDCDSDRQGKSGTNCRMRWNGHAQGKTYHKITGVTVEGNQVAYSVQVSENGDYKVVWGRTEGEAFQVINDLRMLGNQPIYVANHANGLTYVVKGRQKEAFRSVSNFQVVEDKVYFVGQKDSAASPSPI